MYLLFVDESGTHGGNHPFVLGGLAIHEDDTSRLQRDLDQLVISHLGRVPLNLDEFELHAGDMRNAKKPKILTQRASIWADYPRQSRLALLDEAYNLISSFAPGCSSLPHALFGIVVDRRFRPDWNDIERERFAYEVLLNKFDVMLKRRRVKENLPNRGLVIHDRRVVAERDIQQWTSEWREAAGTIGQLRNLADVPLFTDSRATRLLQVADLVSYALFRRYNPDASDPSYLNRIWCRFDDDNGVVHGCVHYTPSYGSGRCECVPCRDRLIAEADRRGAAKPSGSGRNRATNRSGAGRSPVSNAGAGALNDSPEVAPDSPPEG